MEVRKQSSLDTSQTDHMQGFHCGLCRDPASCPSCCFVNSFVHRESELCTRLIRLGNHTSQLCIRDLQLQQNVARIQESNAQLQRNLDELRETHLRLQSAISGTEVSVERQMMLPAVQRYARTLDWIKSLLFGDLDEITPLVALADDQAKNELIDDLEQALWKRMTTKDERIADLEMQLKAQHDQSERALLARDRRILELEECQPIRPLRRSQRPRVQKAANMLPKLEA